jgi:cytochrome c
MMDRKQVGNAVRRLAPVIAVVAAAGAGVMAFAANNVSAAETHRALLTTPVEGVQFAQAAAPPVPMVFVRCFVCHNVERGQPNKVGPNLFGVVGRKAAEAPGFNYSPAMRSSNIVWTDEALSRYIQDPPGTVPGNKMALAKGAVNAATAAEIIAFLKTKM